MSDDHDFALLQKAEFFDANSQQLALRLQTEPVPRVGRAFVLAFLIDETRARRLLRELTNQVEQKWGKTH